MTAKRYSPPTWRLAVIQTASMGVGACSDSIGLVGVDMYAQDGTCFAHGHFDVETAAEFGERLVEAISRGTHERRRRIDYGGGMSMSVIDEIAIERDRQVSAEGWTPEHDDEHDVGQLAQAAAAYAKHASTCVLKDHHHCLPQYWPWSSTWWKPKNPRRDLVRAAALIVAEIERIDRSSKAKQP